MIKYFIRQNIRLFPGPKYSIGKFDTDEAFRAEGIRGLINVISISIDEQFVSFRKEHDFIYRDELEDLKYITEEQYADWQKLCDQFEATFRIKLKQTLSP